MIEVDDKQEEEPNKKQPCEASQEKESINKQPEIANKKQPAKPSDEEEKVANKEQSATLQILNQLASNMAATSKMCQSLLQRHVTFESTITLKLREIEDEMHTLQERSTLAELQVPVFPTSTPTKSVTPDTGQWQEQPSRLTVTCSTPSLPHVADEVVPEANKALLSPSHVSSMRANSVSRENFSTRLVKELFSSEERVSSNVRGIGKPKLDEKKIALVRKLTFANFPCASTEEKASWSRCIKAIDSASRALSRKEKENRN